MRKKKQTSLLPDNSENMQIFLKLTNKVLNYIKCLVFFLFIEPQAWFLSNSLTKMQYAYLLSCLDLNENTDALREIPDSSAAKCFTVFII